MNIINNFIKHAKIYTWNFWNDNTQKNKIYHYNYHVYYDDFDENNINKDVVLDDKESRINTLLFIKQMKNCYFKYTNKEFFNVELYETFIKDENFDGGMTAFDDDENTPIFDKYILEYIKNRNNIITYLQCKKENIEYVNKIEDLKSKKSVLFVIDMNEKDLFKYCYNFIQKTNNIYVLKDIIFSLIIKDEEKNIKLKINNFYNKDKNHAFLILERLLI